MRRWIIKQWNLKSRAFLMWRQRTYRRCVEFYAIERAIYMSRKKGKGNHGHKQGPGRYNPEKEPQRPKLILTHKGAIIGKMSRQLRRQAEREQEKGR